MHLLKVLRIVLHDVLLRRLAHQVPVAFAGVELDCKPTRVPQSLGRTPLVDNCAETHNHRGLHARGAEDICTRQVGDVMGDLQAKNQILSSAGGKLLTAMTASSRLECAAEQS